MLKVNETADIVYLANLYEDRADKGKIIFWALNGAMTETEFKNQECTRILVSAESKKLIDENLPHIPHSELVFTDNTFVGAEIVVSQELENHVPKGLAI